MKTTVKTRKDTVLGFLLKPEVNTISFTSSNTAHVAEVIMITLITWGTSG